MGGYSVEDADGTIAFLFVSPDMAFFAPDTPVWQDAEK